MIGDYLIKCNYHNNDRHEKFVKLTMKHIIVGVDLAHMDDEFKPKRYELSDAVRLNLNKSSDVF